MSMSVRSESFHLLDCHRRYLQEEWKAATLLQLCSQELNEPSSNNNDRDRREITSCDILKRIEEICLRIISSIASGRPPSVQFNSRTTWDNVGYTADAGLQMKKDSKQTTVKFGSHKSVKKFSLILKLLSIIYTLIQEDRYCTKRDIYYQEANAFGSQSILDDLIDSVSCMLEVPRWKLHVLTTSKGLVAGELKFSDSEGNFINCNETTSGIPVPSHVNGMSNISCDAQFILIIEKDATFQKLLDDKMIQKMYPCLLITGKGYPDMNTRLLLRKLWDIFQIPTFAVVDADPHGFEIMSVYRFGSRSLSFENHHLVVPYIRWIGVFPSDLERFQISEDALLPLTSNDIDKIKDLTKRPYVRQKPELKKELEVLLQLKKKAEIQCLATVSSNFLCDVYLPGKIKYGGWI